MDEIAEELVLPNGLGDEFYNRGYYGTLSTTPKPSTSATSAGSTAIRRT